MTRFIAIIPARYASTRFPGKPLALLGGKPVIEHVYTQVSRAIDNVVVATDDHRIADAVTRFGGKAVMTRSDHRSGTDRCYEAYLNHGGNEEIVINVQGDEPFVDPRQITAIMQCFDDPDTRIATLVKPVEKGLPFEALANPNTAKVVVAANGDALYFSRSVIPFLRGVPQEQWTATHQFFTHLGMYAYTAPTLARITALQPSSLEIAESLEQLRWLQNGLTIKTAVTSHATIGIDTPADLQAAERYLQQLTSQQQ